VAWNRLLEKTLHYEKVSNRHFGVVKDLNYPKHWPHLKNKFNVVRCKICSIVSQHVISRGWEEGISEAYDVTPTKNGSQIFCFSNVIFVFISYFFITMNHPQPIFEFMFVLRSFKFIHSWRNPVLKSIKIVEYLTHLFPSKWLGGSPQYRDRG